MVNIEICQELLLVFYIKIYEIDNVVIIVNDYGFKVGICFLDGLELIEYIL